MTRARWKSALFGCAMLFLVCAVAVSYVFSPGYPIGLPAGWVTTTVIACVVLSIACLVASITPWSRTEARNYLNGNMYHCSECGSLVGILDEVLSPTEASDSCSRSHPSARDLAETF